MSNFSVVNNLSALIARNEGANTRMLLQNTLGRLSSGLRVRNGADDAAGLAIADGLKGQIRTLEQSVRNANDGIAFAQTADGALSQVQNLLQRAAALLTEAESDTNSNQESAIETELGQIYSEINRIGGATKFNGVAAFSNTARAIFVGDTQNTTASQAEISFTASALSTGQLAVSAGVTSSGTTVTVDITATNTATVMLGEVKTAIEDIAARRGRLGASMNRLQSAATVMQSQMQNLTAAESQIRDANVAEEVANLTKYQILSQTALAAMAQANSSAQGVLALFR